MEALLAVLTDAIASKLSFGFVTGLKKMIKYEIVLIEQLEIKRELGLMFD